MQNDSFWFGFRNAAVAFALLLMLVVLVACGGNAGGGSGGAGAGGGKLRLAFVVNMPAEFWTIAEHGVNAAAAEVDVDVSFHVPAGGLVEQQKRILEDLVVKGVDGIAVSPRDAENMTGLLDKLVQHTLLITHDSDAPQSKRLAYVGMANYDAGRMCGKLVKSALPDGGKIVILVGTLDQDNAKGRRQGVIDELFGRSYDPTRFDAQGAKLAGGGYEVLTTYTTESQPQKCKANTQDALVRWPDIGCFVGLFEYEPPAILEAVRSAKRLGEVKIVGFDENDATLQGILDGHIVGTVVQNPYEYGRQSIKLLAKLASESDPEKRAALLPEGGFLDIPARSITAANVDEFWADLKQKTGR
ncbi:MAG: sugar-binding protein [bacterium]|nr:sugar-binding protein [bacterium]